MIGPVESKHHGSVGRLVVNMEAKIVDTLTGEALPPGQKGELWLRGPCIMKGKTILIRASHASCRIKRLFYPISKY